MLRPPWRGSAAGGNFWLRLTTASTRSVCFSSERLFHHYCCCYNYKISTIIHTRVHRVSTKWFSWTLTRTSSNLADIRRFSPLERKLFSTKLDEYICCSCLFVDSGSATGTATMDVAVFGALRLLYRPKFCWVANSEAMDKFLSCISMWHMQSAILLMSNLSVHLSLCQCWYCVCIFTLFDILVRASF